MKVALSVAGMDNTAGAGLLADVKTFRAFSLYGVGVLTALAVQNTRGVKKVIPLSPNDVLLQLSVLFEDLPISGAKIGMLSNGDIARAVASFFKKNPTLLITDPVLRSKSGKPLLDEEGIKVLKEEIFPLSYLITPNADEASALCEMSVERLHQAKKCAKYLYKLGARNVLIKGGHLKEDKAVDLLYDGRRFYTFRSARVKGKEPRGTGCVFSSALLSLLILGHPLVPAVRLAKRFITRSIKESKKLGKGYELMNP